MTLRLDQVLHGVMDGVPESYLPLIEHLENSIYTLHDIVMERRDDAVLEHLGEVRGTLLELRRVLTATRQVASHLRHISNPVISIHTCATFMTTSRS